MLSSLGHHSLHGLYLAVISRRHGDSPLRMNDQTPAPKLKLCPISSLTETSLSARLLRRKHSQQPEKDYHMGQLTMLSQLDLMVLAIMRPTFMDWRGAEVWQTERAGGSSGLSRIA